MLQCYPEIHCVIKWYENPVSMCYRVKHVLLCFPVVFCDVHPSLGLKCMQDLGVEETWNWIDKPSEERSLTKR